MRLLVVALVPLLLAAGCVAPSEELGAASVDPALDATTATMETPFAWDGTFTPAVTGCPVVTCVGVRVSPTYMELAPSGTISALSLTMTWDALTPNMAALRFGITWDEDTYESVEGSSPLVLELADLNISRGDDPYVWVWIPSPDPLGVIYVATEQDFHVEGTLTEFAPEPPSAEA